MRPTDDWVQFALDRPVVREPGNRFCYAARPSTCFRLSSQKATGMTALDFARRYLFEPLGITEVYLAHDPQGYSHGWGDLYLHPQDMAKLGYLWLNGGAWDGQADRFYDLGGDAVQRQPQRRINDDYGYGWWVSETSYSAIGRGGQTIKVYPP